MAVAKSYETLERIGEPFEENNKMYIIVVLKSGKQKKVRWYDEPPAKLPFDARHAFGFDEAGYITLFKGDNKVIENWAYETDPCRARYNLLFGWYNPSWLPVENLPDSVTPVRLNWEEISENNVIRDYSEVIAHVNSLLYEPNTSRFQGQPNDWLEKEVTIRQNVDVESRYGGSHMHIMEDADGNVYVWNTASKNLPVDSKYMMKMKVKEHQEYKGTQQTIVYYCKIK